MAGLLTLACPLGCGGGSADPPVVVSPSAPAAQPDLSVFEDATARSGVAFTYKNGEEAGHFVIIESLGGGVALLDYDGDGKLDVFLPGGGFYDGKQVKGHPCRLYRNLGGLRFEDVSAATGIASANFPYSHGAAALDFDTDGWADLLVSGYDRLVLLRNEPAPGGGRRFADVTAAAGLGNARGWASSVGWADLDGDGFPEVYSARYGDWGFDGNHPTDCTYDGKTRDVCQPAKFKPLAHALFRNTGKGGFADASAAAQPKNRGRGMGVVIADLDNDGRPDIYVANDTDDNFLFMNRGTKPGELKLEEVGLLANVARDDRGGANGSMGVDVADFDRSGRGSVVVTNYENELPALYANRTPKPGAERFDFATLSTGLSAVTGAYVSWGVGFADFQQRGHQDLLIVSGHAIRFPTKLDRRQKPLYVQNEAGRLKPRKLTDQYFAAPHNARGLAIGDLDNDGKPDLVVSHLNEPVAVLRNVADTAGKHWLGVELAGKGNRCVVGARVVVETADGRQTRFAKGGGSFASTPDPRHLFGLGGSSELKKVTVHWPFGGPQEYTGLAADGYWRLTEGDPTPKRLAP